MTQTAVLRPYGVRKPIAIGWRVLLFIGLIFVATIYGMLSAVLPMKLLFAAASPIFLIVGLCMWLLPDVGGCYGDTYAKLLGWSLVLHILWPDYIALSLPGFPWIGPMRIVTAMLVCTFLFNLAISSEARQLARESSMADPFIGRMFWAFWLLTTVTIVLSRTVGFSFNRYMNNQIFWTMMFVLAAMVARKPGYVGKTLAFVLLGFAVALAKRMREEMERTVALPADRALALRGS